MKFRSSFAILFLSLAAVLLFSSVVFAQEPKPTPSDDQVNAVAKQMYCPVCENIPLDVCPTQACAQWRDLIRLKLSEGWTAQQIKDYFVQQYGDRVLATPPARGLNWLVYVLPPIFFLAAAFILYRALRSMRAKSVPQPVQPDQAQPPKADPSYLSRFEEELKKRE